MNILVRVQISDLKKDTPGFNLENGDILYCMDDQTAFMYDVDADDWLEQ